MTATAPSLPQEYLPEAAPPLSTQAPEPDPIAGFFRAMRGRWRYAIGGAVMLGSALSAGGYLSGVELYGSQAILRVFPQESNILYATGDESVLKTFDSFVKAETSYVASHMVMARALDSLTVKRPDIAGELRVSDLTSSIEIRRNDSLIVLTTLSRDPAFATEKLEAVVTAYMTLTAEAEDARFAVRLEELYVREAELVARLADLRVNQLDIGGEFGLGAIARAHDEKIAQIDALSGRLSEIAATLAALGSEGGGTSADAADQEIMRATLLDRTMGDLGTERASLMGKLARLRTDFADRSNPRFDQRQRALVGEISVVEGALADRRDQIRVLAQTGALTEAGAGAADTNAADIRNLHERVRNQLEVARLEARDLNRRRIELDQIEGAIQEAETLLGDTRHALEVIRLESGRALPGYTVLMSPPSQPLEPADDSRKVLAAGGLAGGTALAFFVVLGLGLAERRIRFAESLTPVENLVPVLQVAAAGDADPDAADRLRNELQLQPLRRPRLVGKAPVIAIARAEAGGTSDLAYSLAESYARARMKTLFVEADIGQASRPDCGLGWSDILSGEAIELVAAREDNGVWEVPAGTSDVLDDRAVSAPMVRRAIDHLARSFDVVIVSAGSLQDCLSCQFLLSAADLGVLALRPTDRKAAVLNQIDRFHSLPNNGSVCVMRTALRDDPWLAIRT